MKKILNILIVLVLMASLTPLTLAEEAEDNVEIDEETQEEVEIMVNKVGAQIRLLQLEKVITINIVQGEYVISLLNDINTSMLKAFLAELRLVKEEVQSADPNASDAVETFIDLKSDAIGLITDFRTRLHTLVDNETAESFKDQIKEMSNETVENLGQKIHEMVREYNVNQLYSIYGFLGKVNDSLIKGYKNGNYSMEQVKQNVSEMARKMTEQKRYEVLLEMKEYNIRRGVEVQQYVADAMEGFQERKQRRLEERLNNIPENVKDDVKKYMEQNLLDSLDEQNGKPENLPTGGG